MPQDSNDAPPAAPGISLWKWIAWTAAILVGLWVAITAVQRHRMEKLRSEVESRGGRLEADEILPGWYSWLRKKIPNSWAQAAHLKLRGSFRRVVRVHVPSGIAFPPDFISRLTCFKQLKRLELLDCHLTDADLAGLSEFAELRHLDLRKNPVSDRGLSGLDKLLHLEVIALDETRVGDEVLRQALRLPNLITLSLSQTDVSDEGLLDWGASSKLKCLILNGTRISDLGLESLPPLPNLLQLSVNGCAITDRRLAKIDDVRFPVMTSLGLSQTQVTADGVSQLRLNRLQDLSFPSVSMTDEHWRGLAGLKKLDYVQWGNMSLRREEVFPVSGPRVRLDSFITGDKSQFGLVTPTPQRRYPQSPIGLHKE